jgi:hypothetical protein
MGGFLGVLVMIGLGLARALPSQQEIFPFYSWFLFAVVPNAKTTYQVFFHRIGDREMVPPRAFTQASGLIGNARSIVAHRVIQRLGAACAAGDEEEVARQRRLLEGSLPAGTQYEVMAVQSDPVAEWREHKTGTRKSLRSFEVEAPTP